MPENKDFMDSPWIQLGVPLAATAAAAIAPRHAGRVSALGLDAFQGVNAYRLGQKRLSQIQQQDDQTRQSAEQEIVDLESSLDDLYKGVGGTPDEPAPAGGGTPEADMNAKTDALGQGQMAKPNFRLSEATYAIAKRLARSNPALAKKIVADEVASYQGSNNQYGMTPERLSSIKLPPGMSMSGVPGSVGGSMAWDPVEDPSQKPADYDVEHRTLKGKSYRRRINKSDKQPIEDWQEAGAVDYNPPAPREPKEPKEKDPLFKKLNSLDNLTLSYRARGGTLGDEELDAAITPEAAKAMIEADESARDRIISAIFTKGLGGGVADKKPGQ